MCVSSTFAAAEPALDAVERASAATSRAWSAAPVTMVALSALIGALEESPERGPVEQLDDAPLHLDEAVALKA